MRAGYCFVLFWFGFRQYRKKRMASKTAKTIWFYFITKEKKIFLFLSCAFLSTY